jgi:hypothetical protein
LNSYRSFEKYSMRDRGSGGVSKNASSHDFYPEWGCLAPAPNFLRTIRTVAVATAIGAAVGGGAVLSFAAYSEKAQTSVAQRTLVGPVPAVPTAINMPQSSPEKASYAESKEGRLSRTG